MHSISDTAPGPKTTLAGLRYRFHHEVQRPEPLEPAQWERLDAQAQRQYDDARLRWFGSGMWVRTPQVIGLMRALRGQLRTSDDLSVGESGIVVTGPAHIGKTTALWKAGLLVEQRAAKADPHYQAHGVVPVVYIEVPPNATPKTMAAQIVEFFGTPYDFRNSNQHQIVSMATDLLRVHRTQVLIIDELQMVRLDGRTGDAAINTLKTLMNSTGALMVFGGVDLMRQLSSRAAEQIVARCDVLTMTPYTAGSEAARQAWAALVQQFAGEMMLLGAEPDHLAPWADRLLLHSRGSIGSLRRTLSRALTTIIDERDDPMADTGAGHHDGAIEAVTEDVLFGLDFAAAAMPEKAPARPSRKRAA